MKERLKKAWDKLGPGLITGSSDDDPSGIATYTQAGAKFGLSTLWTALITYPLMYFIQEMCARIGIVSGLGFSGVIKKHYPKFYLYLSLVVLFPAITFNIAADIVGMGAVANLLFPLIPTFAYSCGFTIILIILPMYYDYKQVASVLKWLCASLLVYLVVPFLVKQDWREVVFATFIPTVQWNQEYLTMLVAILGTTISPYLFLWQTSMAVEERNHKSSQSDRKEVKDMRTDVKFGMFFSNLVMYFIILTAGTVLFPAGVTQIDTVEEAALALKPLAGEFAYLLFALGVIGTGFLAIPVLAGSLAYLFAEAFGWKMGLDKKPLEAKSFYGVMLTSMVIALFLNIFGLDPIKALIYAAILYGIIAPFQIALILHIANSKKIMGAYTNKWLSNLLGIITLLLMAGAAFSLLLFAG